MADTVKTAALPPQTVPLWDPPQHNHAEHNGVQVLVQAPRRPSHAEVLERNAAGVWMWRDGGIDLLPAQGQPDLPQVCYIFLENGNYYKGEDRANPCLPEHRRKILAPFGAPDLLAGKMCTDLNGYFGCRSSLDPTGTNGNANKLKEFSTWFRFLTKYVMDSDQLKALKKKAKAAAKASGTKKAEVKDYLWCEMGFFTRWTHDGEHRVLCIGTPPEMRGDVKRRLDAEPDLALFDPFAMVRVLLDEVVKLYDEHTWRVTKMVRKIERNRHERPSFENLNNLSRHVGHMTEVETAASETLARIAKQQTATFGLLPAPIGGGTAPITEEYKNRADECLAFDQQIVSSVRLRTAATNQRLSDEITLAYNMLASSDNTVMKSIILLTMVFLPATFVSSLFSTTFFSYADNDGWNFSKKFWIYWAVVIPLTLLILILWWLWRLWLGGYKRIRTDWLNEAV